MRVDFTMQGDQQAMAYNLGMLTSLAVAGTRKYLTASKVAEARVTVARILKSPRGYQYRGDAAQNGLWANKVTQCPLRKHRSSVLVLGHCLRTR
jgi:hypothetical protein